MLSMSFTSCLVLFGMDGWIGGWIDQSSVLGKDQGWLWFDSDSEQPRGTVSLDRFSDTIRLSSSPGFLFCVQRCPAWTSFSHLASIQSTFHNQSTFEIPWEDQFPSREEKMSSCLGPDEDGGDLCSGDMARECLGKVILEEGRKRESSGRRQGGPFLTRACHLLSSWSDFHGRSSSFSLFVRFPPSAVAFHVPSLHF